MSEWLVEANQHLIYDHLKQLVNDYKYLQTRRILRHFPALMILMCISSSLIVPNNLMCFINAKFIALLLILIFGRLPSQISITHMICSIELLENYHIALWLLFIGWGQLFGYHFVDKFVVKSKSLQKC